MVLGKSGTGRALHRGPTRFLVPVSAPGLRVRVVARREAVTVTDDFDGSDNARTVRFGLDGDTYEVDLSATNEEELRGFLNHYIQVGRRLST